MRSWWKIAVVLVVVAVAAGGLTQVRFNTDVLAVLPQELPEVKGLKAYQEVFSRDDELVVLIEGPEEDAGMMGLRAEELAGLIREAGLSEGLRWQPRWRDDPEGLAELVAWLWLNGGTEEAAAQVDRLGPEKVEGTLIDSLETVATALDGGEMMLSANDPFGFLGHSSMTMLFAASEHEGEGFESGDGRSHLLFIDAPTEPEGYAGADAWISELKAVAEPWAEGEGLRLWWTGDPAFQAEIGTSMERDMSGTAGVTAALIGLLFLLMQRRLGLLAGLATVLGLVFVTAMGLAGWIYGELSIMAAGFAAILIGLVVDYGVLICQEAKVAGHDARAIRGATATSIGWAAATTAAVFFALNLSGLPGISQLGTIVALGVIAGAVMMLTIYVPWAAKVGAGRPEIAHKTNLLPGRGRALAVVLALVVGAGGVLAWKGLPAVEFDQSLLRPRDSEAMTAFEKIREVFPGWDSPVLKLVVEGDTDGEVRERLAEAEASLAALAEERPGLVRRVELPLGWWPTPERIEANRARFEELAEDRGRVLAAADEVGFSDEGVGLGRQVLESFPEVLAMAPGEMPEGPAAEEIMRGTVAKDPAGGRLLGSVEVARLDELSAEDLAALRSVSGEGVHLAGWALLKPAVGPLVRDDLVYVFLPMLGLMMVMLSLVFRNVADVALSLAGMALSGLLLLTGMRLFGLSWNFLNIAATPLLLGVGLDYTIHLLLAVKRTGGDLRAVWHGTGKAVLFCGCSTAIGFGSLAFASIDALASLGKVAVLGIVIIMAVSTFLLPAVRVGGKRA